MFLSRSKRGFPKFPNLLVLLPKNQNATFFFELHNVFSANSDFRLSAIDGPSRVIELFMLLVIFSIFLCFNCEKCCSYAEMQASTPFLSQFW